MSDWLIHLSVPFKILVLAVSLLLQPLACVFPPSRADCIGEVEDQDTERSQRRSEFLPSSCEEAYVRLIRSVRLWLNLLRLAFISVQFSD